MFPETQINTSPEASATETVEIDLNAEVVADNPDADFNERQAPPLGGFVYAIQWELDSEKGGVVPAMTKNQVPYVHLYIKGKLSIDGKYSGYVVRDYLNSIVFSSGTSEIHHFLYALGEPIPQRIHLAANPGNPKPGLKDKVEEILSQNPTGLALCDWRASYQDGINPKNGKAKYVDFKVGMANFPKYKNEETGQMEHQFILSQANPKDGTDLIARFEVVKHVSAAEVNKEKLTMAS